MSYYVRRTPNDPARHSGYVGPIRSPRQAQLEAVAWVDAGWSAVVLESTPEVRAEVRAWEKAVRARRDQ